ncbi:MAG: oxaloacetate-decarboxylating malate dehydrogenase [Synechococcaceae bacterium WB9_2_170]|nr:oxaloacetate-decarboxylating malate dehydrogenase [Synechococcaceae bacterium WB9_2_170]
MTEREPSPLQDPLRNKGTAFSREERRSLGLEALLPYQVETLHQQVARCWQAVSGLASDLERYAYLQTLRQNNLVLFHALLAAHIEALMPVVYTPTVGRAIQQFSRSYRSPSHALYLHPSQQDQLAALLSQACPTPPELLLVTDAEGILGIGDQGVGGVEICHGKLAVYTLCAGLHPGRSLPVMLDVGTNNPALLNDPLYPGLREPRLTGEAYDAFLAAFVAAVQAVWPHTLVHWEDFGARQGRRLLERFGTTLPSFNDDIQGTSGVAAAAILAGLKGQNAALRDQKIVIFGAGSAGCGIAERLHRLLQRQGLGSSEAADRIWLIDRFGLIHQGMQTPEPLELNAVQQRLAKRPEQIAALRAQCDGTARACTGDGQGPIGLEAVIGAVKPTVLIGCSTVAGAFNEAVITSLCAGSTIRPLVFPLSNPTQLAEATPSDLLRWSQGRVLVATGSPFEPVINQGRERQIGQCNNCFLYPGLGFAAMAVGASQVSDSMIEAGLEALAERIPAAQDPDAALMPPLAEVQAVSAAVAEAVALAAVAEGLSRRAQSPADAIALLAAHRWQPLYREGIETSC